MKLNGLKAAFIAAGLMGVATVMAQVSAIDKQVTVFLKDADLLQATQLLSQQTGLRFVVSPTGEGQTYAKINLSLSEVSAADAIQYICQAAGAYAERDENGVFVIRFGEKRVEATTTNVAVPKKIITRKAFLKRADARDVVETIKSGQGVNPDHVYREMLDMANQLNDRVSPMRHMNTMGVAVPFDGPDSGYDVPYIPTANQRRGGGGGGEGLGGQGGGLGGGGLGGGGLGGQGGGLGGQGGGLGQGGGDFSQLTGGEGLVPDGVESLGYDPSDNSIIFRGTDEAFQELLDLLELFDIAPKQVVVKVEFITTSNSIDKSLGIDWFYERGGVFAGARPGYFARNSDPVFLNYATGNISTRLRTLLASGYGRVVNSPLVRTMNNQLAIVNFTQNTTIFLNQAVVNNNTTTIVSQPSNISITTGLIVRPRINGDNTITMSLTPQISDFGQVRRGPDGQEIPDTLTQFLSVSARVRNGETVALGGLTRKQDTFSESRFPILGDLPIIGQLFRNRNSQETRSELIIFVTPRVVADNESGINP